MYKTTLQKASVCFLWMVLHHRLFIQPLAKAWNGKRSGLADIFTRASVMEEYRRLTSTSVKNWTKFNFPQKRPTTAQPAPLGMLMHDKKGHEKKGQEQEGV